MSSTSTPDGEDADREAVQASLLSFAAALARIAKSHAGRSQPEILAALLSAARDAGMEPNDSHLARLAEHLSGA